MAVAIAIAIGATVSAMPAAAIELTVMGDRLLVTGEILDDDDFVMLSTLVARRETVQVVHFHQMPGGAMAASLRMGRMIRARGLDTIATSICMSGCALAFLGGVNRRFAVEGSERMAILALHGPSITRDPNAAVPPHLVDAVATYIGEMTGGRASASIVDRITSLRRHDFVYFAALLPPGARVAAQTGTLECQSSQPLLDPEAFRRNCRLATDMDALELGIVTTNFVYRLAPDTPYRRP